MRNMFLIITNIIRVTFRKKGSILVYICLPVAGVLMSVLIYGNAGSSALRVGIANNDTGAVSEDLKAILQSSDIYRIFETKEGEMNIKLLDAELDAAIIIPEGYSESIYNGNPKQIEIISLKGQETTVWIRQILNNFTDTLNKLSAASDGNRAAFDKMYEQYKVGAVKLSVVKLEDRLTGRNMTVTSIGFLIMFIMFGAGTINMIILKEKRDRTYQRICTAPVSGRQYIAGNAITSLLIVTVQILIILAAMKYVFRIDTGVSNIDMFVILLAFALVAVGIGLVITAFSSSSYMANTLNTFIITPTCMLGGCLWDIDFMPEIMQKIAYFVPQRWAMDAIQQLQNGGAETDVLLNLIILAAFAAAFILTAIYRFSRSGNIQKFV